MSTMRYDELCAKVTATIVDTIESGHAGTWRAPWHHNGTSGLFSPTNAATGRPYAGANILLLAIDALEAGYGDNTWATYKQWQHLGAQVRRGEHGTHCVKWITKITDTDQPADTDEQRRVLIPRVFTVFNVAQVDGWEPPAPAALADHSPIRAAEQWIAASGADISYGHDHAAYLPATDTIEVPALGQYPDPLDHYSTVCHELIHFTSHPSRCNRQLGKRFGDDAYAAEELVAELGVAFTTARLGLTNTPRPDHVAYLSHWLRILKADPKALFAAASQAQNAVDFLAALTRATPQPDDRSEAAA